MLILSSFTVFLVTFYFSEALPLVDNGFFWHLTDFHLEIGYKCGGKLGNYNCDSPIDLIKSALDASQADGIPKPDFVVWTGDTGPHRNVTMKELKDTVNAMSEMLRDTFSTVEWLVPVMGNHDFQPANSMNVTNPDPDRSEWCQFLHGIWQQWIPKQDKTFAKFCYTSHVLSRLKLVVLNLNGMTWYAANPQVRTVEEDPLGQFQFMRQQLDWARANDHRVILASHFPMGAPEWDPKGWTHLNPKYNDILLQLVQEYADVIVTFIAAHEHTDTFRVILDREQRKPVGTMFLAPSVVPFHMDKIGAMNPRIRLFNYDRTTGQLISYMQYRLDLDHFDQGWQKEYDAKEAYFLDDLSPPQMHKLLKRFITQDDEKNLWSRYWDLEMGGRPHESRWASCPKAHTECRCEHTCAMLHVNLTSLTSCLESCVMANVLPVSANNQPASSSTMIIVIGVILSFLVVLVGIVLLVNREVCKSHYAQHAAIFTNMILRSHNHHQCQGDAIMNADILSASQHSIVSSSYNRSHHNLLYNNAIMNRVDDRLVGIPGLLGSPHRSAKEEDQIHLVIDEDDEEDEFRKAKRIREDNSRSITNAKNTTESNNSPRHGWQYSPIISDE